MPLMGFVLLPRSSPIECHHAPFSRAGMVNTNAPKCVASLIFGDAVAALFAFNSGGREKFNSSNFRSVPEGNGSDSSIGFWQIGSRRTLRG
jgi:hypothetical protein